MGMEQEGILAFFFIRKTGRWSLIAISKTPEDIMCSILVKMRSRQDLVLVLVFALAPNLVVVLISWVRLKFLSNSLSCLKGRVWRSL